MATTYRGAGFTVTRYSAGQGNGQRIEVYFERSCSQAELDLSTEEADTLVDLLQQACREAGRPQEPSLLSELDAICQAPPVIERMRRAFAHVTQGACVMDNPDGPVCFCGLPSAVEAGLCREHAEAGR